MKAFKSLLLSGTVALFSLSLQAEEVVVPVGQQGDSASIEKPRTGLSSDQVREQYGEPSEWSDPVGNPPITSWQYEGFTVYFEYDKVIHSVVKHSAPAQ